MLGMRSGKKQISCILGLCFALSFGSNALAKHTTKKHVAHKKAASSTAPVPAAIYGSQSLAAAINNAIASVDPNLNIGVAVRSMKTGETLYTRNAYRTFVPASILKVMTAEAALLYLGSEYKFQTSFYTDASNLSGGVLYGNLYLVHSGDPTLTYYDLIDLMASLKAQGIQRVEGNIYIDTTAYDQVNYGPGWIWNDKRFCYAAPISASIINHNCLTFKVAPPKTSSYSMNASPSAKFSPIQSSTSTKSASSRSCYIRLGNNPNSAIVVSDCLGKGHYPQGVTTVVSDVMEYNKALLRALFRSSGIQVIGMIAPGVAPANLSVVVTHQSKPLYELVSTMLKKSDNIIAGSLFKKLGETYTRKPGSWENGSYAVSSILAKNAGVNVTNMNALDGSGLSRYNQISPAQMLQVLSFAYHNKSTNYEFISGLPVAGVDGTLKNRLHNISWKVRAKTGTMSGVNSLAGYAIGKDKEPLAFVIIVNGRFGMGWRYKELEDRIVTTLTKYSAG
jgi:D-alanyl-D-alanine carboxypeptidase/D-alanyl-D-alanine-endopeptidase (penicillin-binding protein 4)